MTSSSIVVSSNLYSAKWWNYLDREFNTCQSSTFREEQKDRYKSMNLKGFELKSKCGAEDS
jgi:hypothetical protein